MRTIEKAKIFGDRLKRLKESKEIYTGDKERLDKVIKLCACLGAIQTATFLFEQLSKKPMEVGGYFGGGKVFQGERIIKTEEMNTISGMTEEDRKRILKTLKKGMNGNDNITLESAP